jgi:hypothetical protein
VDSINFIKLKRQCIDESLYLLFSRLQFEDCLENAYRQHLDYPKDNFCLFFLENSLTRLLSENPALANKRFITNRYIVSNASKIPAPIKAYSKFYKDKPAEFVYRQSIFYNLSDIYGLTDPGIKNLKNQRLSNNDTLEFINYEDALQYFQKASKSNNCSICPLYASIKTSETYISGSDNLLEKHLYSLHKGINNFLTNADDYHKKLFVITKYDSFHITNFDYGRLTQNHIANIYNLIQDDAVLNEQYILPGKLKFDERANLLQYFEKIQDYLPDPSESSTTKFKVLNKKHFSCQEVFPELGVILNNNKATRINFLSVNKIQRNTGGYMNLLIEVYDYIINCYSIDLKNNTICKYTQNIGEASDQEILNKATDAFTEMNRLVAKPNSQ